MTITVADVARAIEELTDKSMAAAWAEVLAAPMDRYEINSVRRAAQFLAQVTHESGGFKYVREIWGPTEAQLHYEGRRDLGNVQPGDGSKYRGRGLIQITGRTNYEKAGRALGLPLEAKPELLELPEHAATSACWFWKDRNLNMLADDEHFTLITKRINGGINGLVERQRLWAIAKKALTA